MKKIKWLKVNGKGLTVLMFAMLFLNVTTAQVRVATSGDITSLRDSLQAKIDSLQAASAKEVKQDVTNSRLLTVITRLDSTVSKLQKQITDWNAGILIEQNAGDSLNVRGTFTNSGSTTVSGSVSIIGTPAVTVSGVATAANQATLNGYVDGLESSVDGIEGLLTTGNGSLATIAANTTIFDANGTNYYSVSDSTNTSWVSISFGFTPRRVTISANPSGLQRVEFAWSNSPAAGKTFYLEEFKKSQVISGQGATLYVKSTTDNVHYNVVAE